VALDGQFKSEVQHLLKTDSKGQSRDRDLMAASPSAKRSQKGDYIVKSTLRSGSLDQGVVLHF
jgi:hypothetical protein